MSEQLLIIGKGMAATRLVEELAKRALGRYAVAVIGAEARPAYNRVLLSSLLADEISPADVELKPASWWHARGVTTLYGKPVGQIDVSARTAMLADGTTLGFSKLIFATGSQALRLPLPGADLPGVMTFRAFDDVAAMRAAVAEKSGMRPARVVVIGGGLLGLEAAYGLAKAGAKVTVVHLMDRLMERQLDQPAAALLKRAIEARGIDVLLDASTTAITGEREADGIVLAGGRAVPADLVVLAAGIRPEATLAREAGIAVNRGILVDDGLETSVPGIHAIGECAEHRGVAYGLVEPAYEQARVLADRLAGGKATYEGSLTATNLKVSGVNVFSAGDFLGAEGTHSIVLKDGGLGTYKKLVVKEDRLVGCVLVGETGDGLWYLDLIRRAAPLGAMRRNFAFGRSLVERLAA